MPERAIYLVVFDLTKELYQPSNWNEVIIMINEEAPIMSVIN